MRRTFIDELTKDYKITNKYRFNTSDPNKGFRSRLSSPILNKIQLVESEEIEFIKIAADDIPAGATVLDAGAGQCRYKNAFSHTRHIALDRAIGDESWDYSQINILADLLALPFKSESFDAVLCFMVLEHIAEPLKLLKEFYRILKSSGKLFLSTPQGFGEHQMPHDYFRFSLPGLEYVLRNAGFDIVFIRPMGGYFYFIGSWLKLLPEILTEKIKPESLKRICKMPLKIIFDYIVPYACFYLDRLDEGKGITMYYGCYSRKRSK